MHILVPEITPPTQLLDMLSIFTCFFLKLIFLLLLVFCALWKARKTTLSKFGNECTETTRDTDRCLRASRGRRYPISNSPPHRTRRAAPRDATDAPHARANTRHPTTPPYNRYVNLEVLGVLHAVIALHR